MSLEIRPETMLDFDRVEAIHALAFGGPNEASVVAAIRRSKQHRMEYSLVAELGADVIGHVLLSAVGLEDEHHTLRKVLVLAPLAVDPDHHGAGVGSALVNAALARAETADEPLVIVRGHAAYYPRFGFQPSSHLNIRAPFAVPEDQYMVKPLRAFHPEFRGTVRYPSAFAAVGYPAEIEFDTEGQPRLARPG
jgi:putative acetyltransferase